MIITTIIIIIIIIIIYNYMKLFIHEFRISKISKAGFNKKRGTDLR